VYVMKKIQSIILSIALIFSAIAAISSCAASDLEESHTLFIYLCASTLETKSSTATENIGEMLSANLPKNANIIIETGGAKTWHGYDIPADKNNRYKISGGKLELIESNPSANMGESETLSSFLRWGIEEYPAENYSLIFWDHGGGSLAGVCFDENFSMDSLTLGEIDNALNSLNLSQKFEFIGFDACFMATIDTLTVLNTYTENIIASEEIEPNGGWDYTAVLNNLGREDFYSAVLTSYAKKSTKDYYTLSHIDLSYFSSIMESFAALIETMEAASERDIISAFNSATRFGSSSSDYYDLGNIMSYFSYSDEFVGVSYVNGSLRPNVTGISVYFPMYNRASRYSYLKQNFIVEYSELIENFYKNQSDNVITFINYGENVDNQLRITLTTASLQYLGGVDYVLYMFEYDGDIEIPVVLGNDVDSNVENNQITISFVGRWVEFGGKLLYCTLIDHSMTNPVYEALVKVDGREARLIFSFDSTARTTKTVGITYTDDNYSRIYDLTDGMEICVGERKVIADEPQNVFSEENTFTYAGEEVEVVYLADGYYQYTAYVRDVYGNIYTAGTAVIEISSGNLEIINIVVEQVVYPE